MKTNKEERAQVTEVIIAGVPFQGVMFPDGSYGVTVSQAATLLRLQGTKTKASVVLKRLHPKGFKSISEYIQNESRAQGVVSLTWFAEAIIEAALKGNLVAQQFVRACTNTTLEMYLDVAFSVERDARERVLWNEFRASGIVVRNSATDALRDHLLANGITPQAHHYIHLTETLNKALLGFTAQEYKLAHNYLTKTNMRDLLSKEQLRALEFAEELFVRRLKKTNDFIVALQQTVDLL